MKPKVTIGICGRNCSEMIGPALDSVTRQDFPHELMEIIFVDDGSEDNTLKVVKERLSSFDISSKVLSGAWGGIGKARNTVIQNATGEYIIWVDSDEIIASSFVRKQTNLIEHNPKAGIVTGRLGILKEENLILALDLVPSVVEYSRQDWKSEAKLPGTGGATYRVEAAKQVGGFDEEISGLGEDIDIAIRIRQAGWSILRGDGLFYERHGKLSTWANLLRRSYSQGVQGRKLYRKTSRFSSLYRMNPLSSAIASIQYTLQGYKTTRRKIVFLLPLHFTLKMLVWFYGFTKG